MAPITGSLSVDAAARLAMHVISSRYAPNSGRCEAPACHNTAHYRVSDDDHVYLVCPKHEIPYLHGLQSKRWLAEHYQPPTRSTPS